MYLYCPPPIPCVHLIIDMGAAFLTCIVLLWGKYQMICKLRIAVKSLNRLQKVPAIEFQLLGSDLELLALESRAAWQVAVDKVIEFVDCPK